MKKLFLSLTALTAVLSVNASGTWNLAGQEVTVDTILHATTGPGIVTTGLRLTTAEKTTNIFYSEIDLRNPNIEIRGIEAYDDGESVETVKAMAERRNEYGEGRYVAGVNGDFFNMKGSPTRTNGAAMADGYLYQSAVSTGWNTWAAYTTVAGGKDVKILQSVDANVGLVFPNGTNYPVHIDPPGENGGREANFLCIYTGANGSTTGTNVWGAECTAKIVSGSIADRDAVFEVTCEPVGDVSGNPEHGNMTIPEGGYVISGVTAATPLVQGLKVGDRLSMGVSVKYKGEDLEDVTTIIGGCSMLVQRGEVVPDAYFSPTIVDHFDSNQARTAVGYNKDRSKLYFLVVDNYGEIVKDPTTDPVKQTYGTSSGILVKELAYIMQHLGCYTAMNNDGGGSAMLYNYNLGIRNVPYGSDYLRPVANGVFAVATTDVADNTVVALEVSQKNVKLASGETFTPVVYGFNKDGVLVDANVEGCTLTAAASLGSTAGTTFTANGTQGETLAVVTKGSMKCGVRIFTNGGGAYVTSGDDNAPVMVAPTYEPDAPMGTDLKELEIVENWKFLNPNIDAGWDGTAPNWSSTDAIKSKPCPRFATAYDGKIYTINMMTMSIAEFDEQGNMKDVYKLPSLEGRVMSDVPDFYGCAISRDDAGNFLIGHYFIQPMSNYVVSIYNPKNGAIKHFDLSENLQIPDGFMFDRIDTFGRVVGDLSKDAYVFINHKTSGDGKVAKGLMVHFTGDGNILNTTAYAEVCPLTMYGAGANNTASIAQPKYATAAECTEAGMLNSFYWYSKAPKWVQWGVDLFCFENGNYSPNYAVNWVNYAGTAGFDTFVLNDTRYFVMNYIDESGVSTNVNTMDIIVKDIAGNTLATWKNPDYNSPYGYSSITAVPVSDSEVEIYVYNNTVQHNGLSTGATAGACLTLKDNNATTGIDEITVGEEDSTDAAPVYYNLQGIQVKNPAQGIYIVKKGNKVTKQLIR